MDETERSGSGIWTHSSPNGAPSLSGFSNRHSRFPLRHLLHGGSSAPMHRICTSTKEGRMSEKVSSRERRESGPRDLVERDETDLLLPAVVLGKKRKHTMILSAWYL